MKSKENYLSQTPVEWDTVECKYAFNIQLGKMLENQPSSKLDELVPYLKAINVNWGDVDTNNLDLMYVRKNSIANYEVKNGDLLVCEGGEVGRAGIVSSCSSLTIIQNALHRIRSNTNDVKYLYYYLRHVSDSGWFNIICNKATIAHFTREKIGNLKIGLPTYKKQQKIISFLDKETSRIDNLIAKKKRQIELLKEKRQAIITQAVTKGLDPNAKMKDSGVEWIGEIPEGWDVLQLRRVLKKSIDYRGRTPTKINYGVQLVTARNIREGFVDYSISQEFVSEDEYEHLKTRGEPKLGDVLFTSEAPLGQVAQVDKERIALAQRIILFRCNGRITNENLSLYLRSQLAQSILSAKSSGSTASGIRSDKLYEIPIVVPNKSEQVQIVKYCQKEENSIGLLTERINKSIDLLKEYRSSLITHAVTGQIDIENMEKVK